MFIRVETRLVNRRACNVTSGTLVTLQCTFGDTRKVLWYKCSGATYTPLVDTSRYGGGSVSSTSLTIYSANTMDTGMYLCAVETDKGPVPITSDIVHLKVNGS